MLPTFIVIGAMKAGTTSLYHYLQEHPEIGMSSVKETDYFVEDKNWGKGEAWYRSLFPEGFPAVGEVSPNYTKRHVLPGVAERICGLLPEVKLIYLLRDPVERIVSHYKHRCLLGQEKKPLEELVRNDQCLHYVQSSRYFYQLEDYYARFPEKNLLLLTMEELRHDRVAALSKIYAFLGVDATFVNEQPIVAHSTAAKMRKARLNSLTSNRYARTFLRWMLPLSLFSSKRFAIGDAALSPEATARLRDKLAGDVEQLRRHTGLPFSQWSL